MNADFTKLLEPLDKVVQDMGIEVDTQLQIIIGEIREYFEDPGLTLPSQKAAVRPKEAARPKVVPKPKGVAQAKAPTHNIPVPALGGPCALTENTKHILLNRTPA